MTEDTASQTAAQRLLRFLVLPGEISPFEREYLSRVNRITVQFFLLHIPVFTLIAWVNKTEPLLAAALTTAVAMGPVLAFKGLSNPRTVGIVYGFASMLMGGLLVHFGQGPVQIEMHFYFFALLAMLSLYGNPMAVVVAAATVAFHHLLLWVFLPASVFNYDAPWWVVAVHAGFVVLESAAAVFISRSFFDNVIGLEKVVQARTKELDRRNSAMRLVLDNVDEGLLTLDVDGRIHSEHSAVVEQWFAPPKVGQSFADFIAPFDHKFSAAFEMAWEQVVDGILPVELCFSQAPAEIRRPHRTFRVRYRPLVENGEVVGALLVIADITAHLAQRRLEAEQRETAVLLERAVADRTGVAEFAEEAAELVEIVCSGAPPVHVLRRALHTLKGNCLIYGMHSVAEICHDLESFLSQENTNLEAEQKEHLLDGWRRVERRLEHLLGLAGERRYEIDEAEHAKLLGAVLEKRGHDELAQLVADLKLEPTSRRLRRVAAQAERIGKRLDKGDLRVEISEPGLRLDPERWASFWSALVHVVRNAVDHGIEDKDERVATGKPPDGVLTLHAEVDDTTFMVALEDDGRGVNWQRVRAKAESAGIPSETQEDLVSALFVDGISTAEEVTEFSGRGVGLAAVYAACKERGGDVDVTTAEGKGSRFTFRFPKDAMAPTPSDMLKQALASGHLPNTPFQGEATVTAKHEDPRLELILAATLEGSVEHDLQSGAVSYSDRWHSILGFDAEDRPVETPTLWKEVSHPDDLEEVLEDWESHITHAWPFQRVWRMKHARGGYRWVECRSVVRLDEAGEPTMALSLFADVTGRVEEDERRRALVQAIPDIILRMTVEGRIIDLRQGLHDTASALFGENPDLNRPLSEIVDSADTVSTILVAAKSAADSQEIVECSAGFTHEGTGRSLEVRVAPSGTGEVVCLIRDVTQRQQLESQLLQAQKLESIGQLAAGVAHEINTPLQFIGDNARFAQTALERILKLLNEYRSDFAELESEDLNAKYKKLERRAKLPYLTENGPSALTSCVEGVERVAEIVAAMKEFSHPGSDSPVPSDLNRALVSTATVSRNEWKHIAEMEMSLAEDLPAVSCFAGEVNQCFLNIIVNAAHAMRDKFGEKKSGLIRIETSKLEDGVEIRIQDNGPGIPERVQERIFDPFFTTKGVGQGTGQGLSIARKTIVETHGGDLDCQSVLGEGTTFIIRLPIDFPANDTESETA